MKEKIIKFFAIQAIAFFLIPNPISVGAIVIGLVFYLVNVERYISSILIVFLSVLFTFNFQISEFGQHQEIGNLVALSGIGFWFFGIFVVRLRNKTFFSLFVAMFLILSAIHSVVIRRDAEQSINILFEEGLTTKGQLIRADDNRDRCFLSFSAEVRPLIKSAEGPILNPLYLDRRFFSTRMILRTPVWFDGYYENRIGFMYRPYLGYFDRKLSIVFGVGIFDLFNDISYAGYFSELENLYTSLSTERLKQLEVEHGLEWFISEKFYPDLQLRHAHCGFHLYEF